MREILEVSVLTLQTEDFLGPEFPELDFFEALRGGRGMCWLQD